MALDWFGIAIFAVTGALVATAAGFVLCFAIRALALHDGWSLPAYRARRGWTMEEVEKMRE